MVVDTSQSRWLRDQRFWVEARQVKVGAGDAGVADEPKLETSPVSGRRSVMAVESESNLPPKRHGSHAPALLASWLWTAELT